MLHATLNCLFNVPVVVFLFEHQSKVHWIWQFIIEITSLLRQIKCHMGSHSVTCHLIVVTLPQPKLVPVLNLATLEGSKVELTWKQVGTW